MAQDRKASEEEVRKSLREQIGKAAKELSAASEKYGNSGAIADLRAVQVATDRLALLNGELRKFDGDRSVESLRRSDANPRRDKSSWPVGRPYGEEKPRKSATAKPPAPPKEKPSLPPPAKRPEVLSTKTLQGRNGVEEAVSWWVGADRSKMSAGSRALQTLPPSKTAVVPSKGTIRRDQQKKNEDVRTQSRTLQEQLKPQAGSFSVIPKAE